jgi:hypothetical protein
VDRVLAHPLVAIVVYPPLTILSALVFPLVISMEAARYRPFLQRRISAFIRRLAPVWAAVISFYTAALAYWLDFSEAVVLVAGPVIVHSQPVLEVSRRRVGPLSHGFVAYVITSEAPAPVVLTCLSRMIPDGGGFELAAAFELLYDDGVAKGCRELLKHSRWWPDDGAFMTPERVGGSWA